MSLNFEPLLMAEIIMGGSKEICLKWRREDYAFSVKERMGKMVELLV